MKAILKKAFISAILVFTLILETLIPVMGAEAKDIKSSERFPTDTTPVFMTSGVAKSGEEVIPGCTVTVRGKSTEFSQDTDFRDVIKSVNVAVNIGEEINILLHNDMFLYTETSFSTARNSVLNIDLAGNKLVFASGSAFKMSNNYTFNIYSSVEGGEFIFGTEDDGFMPGSGLIVFGSEEYKNNLTVTTKKQITRFSQLSDGACVRLKMLYSTVNLGSYGLMRVNAKGSGAITVQIDVEGCEVNGNSVIVGYNSSSNLSATTNGGVCSTESYIRAIDSSFTSSADQPSGLFGSTNFKDRYFGSVSFYRTSFKNYVINGDNIYSNMALDYNNYYNSLIGGEYDPTRVITVGGGCLFQQSGNTFNELKTGFMARNVVLGDGTEILVTSNGVETVGGEIPSYELEEEDKTDEPTEESKPEVEPEEKDHTLCEGNLFSVIWNAIVNFFRGLFGMPSLCICGEELTTP